MRKIASLLLVLVSVAFAAHDFNAFYTVTWDKDGFGWRLNDDFLRTVSVAAGRIALFNVTEGGGEFFITLSSCADGAKAAFSREGGVTNNACTPPCVVAMNLSGNPGRYRYCSSVDPYQAGEIYVSECDKCSEWTCKDVEGCGYNLDSKKCVDCMSLKTSGDCNKLRGCEWCGNEGMCLGKGSGACRPAIPRERVVASWVWLLITLCALLVLIAVVLTLFISEASFKKRWAALAKTDKDFAEVGRGNNDGLLATD